MKKNLFVLFLLLSVSFSAFAQTATKKNSPAMKATAEITAKQLSDYLYYVASDEMEGRDTPSRGLDATAKFMATMLSRWGVKPAGDNGTYFQRMLVVRKSTDSAASSLELNGQKLKYGEDFYGTPQNGMANAPIVFGGNGIFHKAKGINSLDGIDVKGKIVVFYTVGLPKGLTNQDFQGGEFGKDFGDSVTNAITNGAVGVINIAPPRIQTNWTRSSQGTGGGVEIENLRKTTEAPEFPIVVLNQNSAKSLFDGETTNPIENADAKSFIFSGNKNANIVVKTTTIKIPTQNVVAMVEGSDPILKNEFVSIGAHYDHDGVRPTAPGEDKIWNGADDDGSGTVALLSMAEALAKSPKKPKRSMLFLWYAGEEKGLLGSEYFTKFPTVAFDKITVNINIDMIGRSRKADNIDKRDKDLSTENEIYVIGSKMMSSTLGEVTESVNKGFMNMTYNYKYDDPKDTNRFFFRSDHYNFAVRGIPAVFFFNGVHQDYHQAGDHPEKIDYVRMEKIARTIFLTMWELGDLKVRPKVDKELPKELQQR
jgi:Peptidase family M28